MEYKKIGNTRIPVLGIGTWRMGGDTSHHDTSMDEEWVHAIKKAIELGMTHIDTAEVYGMGHAEELVAEAIKGIPREKLFITTKVSWEHLKHDEVIAACKGSLKRLETDYVDLYLVHAPDDSVPIDDTMSAMNSLKDQGLIRYIGVSNFSVEQLKAAQRHAEIVNNQIEYNLLARNKGMFSTNMESEIIPYCQKNGILITAFRPLAKGDLCKRGFAILDEMAKKYGKTQAQVAINWLISKEGIITIPKASVEHVQENLGALGWKLSPEDMKRLDEEV